MSATNAQAGPVADKSVLLAYTETRFRELTKDAEQAELKEKFPLLESKWQREYVLLEDFTCVFSLAGKPGLWTTTVPKGCLANGVSGLPVLDDLHPPSWWLHDWHYATHVMTPKYTVVDKDGAPAVNPFEDHGAITLVESDDVFDTKGLRVALDVANTFFGNTFWDQGLVIGRTIVPEWATLPAGAKEHVFPAKGLAVKEGTSGESAVLVFNKESCGCCCVM